MDSGPAPSGASRNDERRELQETLRINVDFEFQIALWLRPRGEPVPQIIRQVEAARRFEQQAEAIAALDDRERRLGRSQQLHALVCGGDGNKLARVAFRGRAVAGRDDQARQPSERWIAGAFARSDFAGIESLAIAG